MIHRDRIEAARNAAIVRPDPFSVSTAVELWTDPHISQQMLSAHLNPHLDAASRTGPFIDGSLRWIIDRFELGPDSRVLDLGCGPGLYVNGLARSGASATGLDVSSRSLAHARSVAAAENLRASYIESNYLSTDLDGQFDLIVMIFCDIGVLSSTDRAQLFSNVRRWLSPTGSFLFDAHSVAEFETRTEEAVEAPQLMNGFWSAEDYHGFKNTFVYEDTRLALDKYTIVGPDGSRVFYNWAQCFEPEQLTEELGEAGLVSELLGDVAGGTYDATSREFALIGTVP